MAKLSFIHNTLGPGLLLAGAAIGVSHLVQATRAGADYGFALWWVLIFACLTKYPFLEFGPRYTSATGQNLITGYRNLGKVPFYLFSFITVGSMFIIQAAVTIVTAGLAEQLFSFGWSSFVWSSVILGASIVLLFFGRYPGLDFSMKIIVSILSLGTLFAVVMAFGTGAAKEVVQMPGPNYLTAAGVSFIIAFIGWMPIPLDSAVWHSIWMKEKRLQTSYQPSLRESLLDFNIGYLVASLLGLLFFLLGALIMFGSGTSFAPGSVAFSAQLVDLYGQTLGAWSRPIISVAAFIAMISTTLAVTDAFPRVMSRILSIDSTEKKKVVVRRRTYNSFLIIIPAVSLFILFKMTGAFTNLVDFAAGISFLSAPVLAWFNYQLVTGSMMPDSHKPGKKQRIFSQACLIALIVFALIYIAHMLGFLEKLF
ncbi:MAG: divalent metal cation transporter [Saprospirales bacterium]|nr:MAG: divalent metal cation transporter [Saprospirales bacterium]